MGHPTPLDQRIAARHDAEHDRRMADPTEEDLRECGYISEDEWEVERQSLAEREFAPLLKKLQQVGIFGDVDACHDMTEISLHIQLPAIRPLDTITDCCGYPMHNPDVKTPDRRRQLLYMLQLAAEITQADIDNRPIS